MKSKFWFVALAASSLITVLAYYPSLYGPFVLDDHYNLAVFQQWLNDEVTWQGTILENHSGPLGRPISMASFLFNTWLSGLDSYWFKLTNLVIHIFCGLLIFSFVRSLLIQIRYPKNTAVLVALLLTTWWLLLPIHTATVAYVVQRMTQLSTLFTLIGLNVFMVMRQSTSTAFKARNWLLLFGLLLCTVLAALSKENGLLLPVYCITLDALLLQRFHPCNFTRRPAQLLFLSGIAAAPVLLWLGWDYLSSGYNTRDFTLSERLLTQARILWDYVGATLLPYGPKLGIFQDNIALSKGIFQPITTVLAILAWVLAGLVAFITREKNPLFLAGFLIFFVGHLMESTIIPLELSFLHRNYLPSLGVLLFCAGGISLLIRHMERQSSALTVALKPIAVLLLLALATATHARAEVWSSQLRLLGQELRYNPNSVRTRSALATIAVNAGKNSAALAQIEAIKSFASPVHMPTIAIWELLIMDCLSGKTHPDDPISNLTLNPPSRLHLYGASALKQLVSKLEQQFCNKPDSARLAKMVSAWLKNNTQDPKLPVVWLTRHSYARLLALSGELEQAKRQAILTFEHSNYQFDPGVLAFQLSSSTYDLPTARDIFLKLKRYQDSPIFLRRDTIEAFAAFLSNPKNFDEAHNADQDISQDS